MTDLVKRLRELATDQDMLAPDNTNDSAELREAADRIEALEAALRRETENCLLCEGVGSYYSYDVITDKELWEECPSCANARAALAGEKKE